MPGSLLSTQVPAPSVPGSFLRVYDAYESGPNAPLARPFAQADKTTVVPSLNENATRMELAGRYAAPYGIAWGLEYVSAVGLTVTFSAGHALIDGVVEKKENFTVNLTPSIALAYVYLLQSGGTQVVNNSTTPPAGAYALLWTFTTNATDVTANDDAGRIVLRQGQAWRQTYDTGAPADTPPAGARMFAKTSGGSYIWNGSQWVRFVEPDELEKRDVKQSVRVATVSAGTLATSFENGDTVDGVVLATGDRILLKNQAAGAENGIYTVNASGAPTRATDANTSAKVTAGMLVVVTEGTVNADTVWLLSTNDAITLGTTALVFAQIAGAGTVVLHASTHAHGAADPLSAFPQWVKVSKTYSDLAAAALSNSITLLTLPAGGVVHAVKLKHSTAFAGGAIATYTVEVGPATDTDKYAPPLDVFQAIGASVYELAGILGGESHTGTTVIQLTARATGANLDQASAGAVDVWVLYSVAV